MAPTLTDPEWAALSKAAEAGDDKARDFRLTFEPWVKERAGQRAKA